MPEPRARLGAVGAEAAPRGAAEPRASDPVARRQAAKQRASALGRAGEEAAAAYLGGLGLHVRARNYAVEGGEVDLVAEVPSDSGEGAPGELVFVEVKARSYHRDAEPMLEAVPAGKRRRIARAALAYCQEHRLERLMRFDVIALATADDAGAGVRVVEHLRGAFGCEGLGFSY